MRAKGMMDNVKRILAVSVTVILAISVFLNMFAVTSHAKALDEILNYEINAIVNDDATVTLTYHIEWKVLDSDSEGPLSWVRVGIPNSHYSDEKALTDNIRSIRYDADGGYFMRIDFNDKYYEGDVVIFEFSIVQDYLYQVDKLEEGYTVYAFTPGWFDDIKVDKMTLRWRADKAESWDPYCFNIVGNLVWMENDMDPGEKFTVTITYPNDAYAFDMSKKIRDAGSNYDDGSALDFIFGILGLLFFFGIPFLIMRSIIKLISKVVYQSSAHFGAQDKKITRTKIVYYDSCPSCGSVRGEGQTKCEYCGHSFIKSEEVIEEKDLKGSDSAAAKFNTAGEYRYTDSPNTYIRVNVIPIPHPVRTYSSSHRSGSSSHRNSSHRSSCAHSSCACACACAGSGRAGCSTKDFYNTDLKLRQLELRKEAETEAETE